MGNEQEVTKECIRNVTKNIKEKKKRKNIGWKEESKEGRKRKKLLRKIFKN